MPHRPRLTPADLTQLTQLTKQRPTVPRLAAHLGLTCRQVHQALDRLGLTGALGQPPRRHASPVPAVGISTAQQQLVARWQQSGLPVSGLAQRLCCDWRQLSHELRGIKQMSARRQARLARLLTWLAL